MKDSDLFEVLKGNLKSIDLQDFITKYEQSFIDWITPHYITNKDKQRLAYARGITQANLPVFHYPEPTWPAGQKRTMHGRYLSKLEKIRHLHGIRSSLCSIAFPKDDEYDVDFEITFEVKRKPHTLESD